MNFRSTAWCSLLLASLAVGCGTRTQLIDSHDGAPSDAGGCANACWTSTVRWTVSGGLAGCSSLGTLANCTDLSVSYTQYGLGSLGCVVTLPACPGDGGIVSAYEIAQSLANGDVRAALASAPVTFGQPVPDGEQFHLEVDGRSIDVFADCSGGTSGCRPIPAGVSALRTLLISAMHSTRGLDRCRFDTGSFCP